MSYAYRYFPVYNLLILVLRRLSEGLYSLVVGLNCAPLRLSVRGLKGFAKFRILGP